MEKATLDLIRGTLDTLVLKTLSWGPLHGYAISSAIHRQTDNALLVEEGALYPALYRMEGRGWIEAEWGFSENNRRAKYYRLTREGRKQLQSQTKAWDAYAEAVGKIMNATRPPLRQEP
ncbi:MAG TPA: PadR family transcriptional regulator [Bryobacteraceae bacterium]|nr:PadR family transcriptional regulator [Bryobacteraceae bacterium]